MSLITLSGTLSGTGPTPQIQVDGYFNLTLSGTFSATVVLQRSFDDGASWVNVSRDVFGNAASFTAPVSLVIYEPENSVLYRLNCTAYSSGTITYRISR